MKRAIFLSVIVLALNSCTGSNKTNTKYTFLTDQYSGEIEDMITSSLSIHDYSPCPDLSISTFDSKVIRYDLPDNNESRVVKRSIIERLFSNRLSTTKYKKRIGKLALPQSLRLDRNVDVNPKNIEYFLNSLEANNTRVFGLNSIGIQYKGLNLNHTIQHFQNIYDLKDALSDYICNEINEKHAVILMHLFTDSGLEDCLAQCESLPSNPVCADDGQEYPNIECLRCYSNLKEIPCDQKVPLFRKENLTEKAFEIFYQFVEAQNLIANDKNARIANDLIDNTLRLFDGSNKVEILNLGTENPIHFTTAQYLKRLRTRPFDQVGIEWDQDWTVTQDWSDAGNEIPESEMMAEGQQYFVGYRKNLVAYSDAIKKNIHFHAKLVETIDENGNEVIEWKVLIGDITIASQPLEL